MPLSLQPMDAGDIDAYVDIVWQAMRGGLMGVMYPNGFSDAARRHLIRAEVKQWREHPERIRLMKVVDTDLSSDDPLNQVVGVSKWKVYPRPRSQQELDDEKAETANDSCPPGADEAFLKAFGQAVSHSKATLMAGDAYMLLHVLATHPDHHRRGIGAMHLQWGLDKADLLGVPVYLEASKMGQPLYARWGFDVLGELPFDGRPWNAQEEAAHTLMLRPAKVKSASA